MRKPLALPIAYHLINHGPCPLLTTGDGVRRNVATINWTMPVSDDPPLVLSAIENGCYTAELLAANGEFVVNVLGEERAGALVACGRVSGREADKFQAAGLRPVPAQTVKPPRLAESIGHLECRVIDTHACGGITLYVGEVLHAEVEEDCFDGKILRVEKARTPHHLGGGTFSVTERSFKPPRPA